MACGGKKGRPCCQENTEPRRLASPGRPGALARAQIPCGANPDCSSGRVPAWRSHRPFAVACHTACHHRAIWSAPSCARLRNGGTDYGIHSTRFTAIGGKCSIVERPHGVGRISRHQRAALGGVAFGHSSEQLNYSSMNVHVFAPSNRRTRTDAMSSDRSFQGSPRASRQELAAAAPNA